VLVDDTADIKLAAKRIVMSKSFDNSILCTNESTVLAFTTIADKLLDAMKAEKAYVCSPEETEKLRKLPFTEHGFNAAMIGKDASVIAREAGFNASGTKILVTPVDLVQPEEKLVREKLCPVLGFAGGSSIGENLTPHHLLHFARIAYNKDAAETLSNSTNLDPLNLPKREARPMSLAVDNGDSELRKELRRIILEELKAVLAA
jgi:hypothetical protein